ncbi:L-rhamnose mutarotase [Zunongwangia sp. HRR-M8]|uniref:L-rhamnose mutarotase n=1 Tax=Zunongwangia sp. HRR-M8 TaxID=3015170 RepID=UPI0022DE2A53|nr:L-rhamnose mutarotase [Zunongwangia sp. HRR-M8]WBL23405.1 L-rhamnose mutarotase [Zunongwangia sp. HRR-M8]
MKRYCLTCDLKDNKELIKKYKIHHEKNNVWPDVIESIKNPGILNMQIFLIHTRLFMIIDAEDCFSMKKKEQMDAENIKVQEWEDLMKTFQQIPDFSKNGEKWVLMDKIFDLDEYK